MMESKNFGLAGGTLDATKHVALASNPVAYMKKLGERPWLCSFNTTDATRFSPTCWRGISN